jgi:hypothetical protein
MKIGRDVKGRQYAPLTRPKLRQFVGVYYYSADETSHSLYPFQLLFDSGNDWVQGVELSLSGMKQLRANLDAAILRASPTRSEG